MQDYLNFVAAHSAAGYDEPAQEEILCVFEAKRAFALLLANVYGDFTVGTFIKATVSCGADYSGCPTCETDDIAVARKAFAALCASMEM